MQHDLRDTGWGGTDPAEVVGLLDERWGAVVRWAMAVQQAQGQHLKMSR